MSAMQESEIIDQVYSLYENDDDTWDSSSSEYMTARNYSKAAIRRWEYYEGTKWPQLWTRISEASDGDKTTTEGVYEYDCPTNLRMPPSSEDYVRTVNNSGVSRYFIIIPHSKVQQLDNNADLWCYFKGNPKTGYKLYINPKVTLSTGETIEYDYYRQATYLTSTTSTTEMENPFFIVHYILSRLYKNDGQLSEANQEMQIAESYLSEMKSDNTEIIDDDIDGSNTGFGY